MDEAPAGSRAKSSDEYMRFFQTLGILDTQKVQMLGLLLQTFYEPAAKLETQLLPTGGAIHVAISRMCEAENSLAAPQHRWIGVFDRLGFFSDSDNHACRVVNIDLS